MPSGADSETLVVPRDAKRSSASRRTVSLPHDVITQSAARLRVLALLYAFVFFMAAFFPSLLFAEDRARLFGQPATWVPGAAAIAVALGVAAAVGIARVPLATAMTLALVFEVVSSYGIASAEFINPNGLNPQMGWMGLSWVAVWTLLFSVVIPTPPHRAVTAALASVSAVPAMIWIELALYPTAGSMTRLQFFFGAVFPYLLVVLMAYVGARVVYALGTEVARARELGSYRLVERLGSGGMGEVWRARHRLLARPAAVKLIRSPAGAAGVSEDAARRFEREAQAIASLRCPHTVTLFDFGVAEDGTFYYVMELLEGMDAERLVRRTGPMPPERVVHILKQICHSLSEAESHGLVHRDIKPANIFVCRYGQDDDFVKVLDFGIVKATGDSAPTQPTLTREHIVPGTPGFMAPEQIVGGSPVDARTDIYATGCVAYWLLTGEPVFSGEPMAVLMHHAQTPPRPPSSRTTRPIPEAVDRLVLSCLAKSPEDRPQSARDLAARLAALQLAEEWTPQRARAWWTQNAPAQDGADGPDPLVAPHAR